MLTIKVGDKIVVKDLKKSLHLRKYISNPNFDMCKMEGSRFTVVGTHNKIVTIQAKFYPDTKSWTNGIGTFLRIFEGDYEADCTYLNLKDIYANY